MRILMTTMVFSLLSACSGVSQAFSTADIHSIYIADFVSDAPQQCKPTDVDLNTAQIKQFFQQAAEVEHKTLHDHYNYAPCAIEGTLTYKQQNCNWQIRASATGYIQCASTYRYFACDNCDNLFN